MDCLKEVDVVLFNAVVFPPDLVDFMLDAFVKHLPSGARIVSLTVFQEILPEVSPQYSLFIRLRSFHSTSN